MTLEELIKLLGENKTILTGVLTHITSLPEGKELLENYANQKKPEFIAAAKADILGGIKTSVLGVVGGTIPEGVEVDAYLVTLANELKTLKANSGKGGDEASKQRITQLEAEIKAVKDADWEGKYNKLTTETAAKIEEYKTKVETLETGNIQSLVGVDLATGLAAVKFNPNIPQEAVNAMLETAKAKIMKTAKVVDGKVVYYKEDGTPYNNELFKPISAEELLKTELKAIVATGSTGGKAPQEAGDTTIIVTEGDKKKLKLDTTKFNSKLSFANHAEEVLIAQGVAKNSEDWNNLVDTARAEYGVENMPRT